MRGEERRQGAMLVVIEAAQAIETLSAANLPISMTTSPIITGPAAMPPRRWNICIWRPSNRRRGERMPKP